MPVRTRFTWTLVFPAAWAVALALVGLRLLVMPAAASGLDVPAWMPECAGATLLAKAQLVFSSWVADPLFPHANPWMSGIVELVAAVAVVAGWAAIFVGFFLSR